LRADHLPAYGYRGVETPALDSLARDSTVFDNAVAHVPLTLPSHVSLFTGLLPFQHGIRDNQGYRLTKSRTTLATFLAERGYATGAAVSAFVLSRDTGVSEGFDFYEDGVESRRVGQSLGQVQRSGWQTEKLLEDWMARLQAGKPFLAFLHLYEPHSPYEPPEPFKTRYASHPYDGEIATADAIVGRFLGFLRSRGLYDHSIIVFLSDHGEGLGDHGEDEHGIFVYRESIRVPLFLKLPGGSLAGRRIQGAVGLVDVFPTVVSVLGEKSPPGLPGLSLVMLSLGAMPGRRIYSETLYPRLHLGWSDLASLTDDRYQYIQAPRPELYDWRSDPWERSDLAGSLPPAFRSMRVELGAMSRPLQNPGTTDPETVRKLAALGYIATTSWKLGDGDLPDPKDRIHVLDRLKNGSRLATEHREEEAVSVLRRLAQENPNMLEVWETLSVVLRRAGRPKEAIEALRQADSREPGTAQILLGLAELYIETQDFQKARTLVQAAAVAGARDVHQELAVIALEQGDLTAARIEIRQALGRDDATRRRPWLVLAQIEIKAGNLEAALADVDRALEIERKWDEPPMVNLQATRGDVLARMRREGEAEEAFRLEIRNFPENLDGWSRLALLYASGQRSVEFGRLLDEMASQMPTRSSYETAARVCEIVGDRSQAQRWHRRAIEKRLAGTKFLEGNPRN
jgi:tetratricopeptide (TPR) repeat protein